MMHTVSDADGAEVRNMAENGTAATGHVNVRLSSS